MVAQDQWLGRGNMGGTHVHTLSTAQMPAHTHNMPLGAIVNFIIKT